MPKFYGLDYYGDPDENKISDGIDIAVSFKGALRDYQKPVVQKWLKAAKKKGCGLIEADCGGGKTCMAIYLIAKLSCSSIYPYNYLPNY